MKTQTIFQFLFSFKGRMTRKPFWITYAVVKVLELLLIFIVPRIFYMMAPVALHISAMVIAGLLSLSVVICGLSLFARRLRDTGRNLVAVLGLDVFRVLACIVPQLMGIDYVGQVISIGLGLWIIIMLCQPAPTEATVASPASNPEDDAEPDLYPDATQCDISEIPDCTQLNGITLEPCDDNFDEDGPVVSNKMSFLSKAAGIVLLFSIAVQSVFGSTQETPYAQLQQILSAHSIFKDAVTDELTKKELYAISEDVIIQFKVPNSVLLESSTVGGLLTNILRYRYAGKRGPEWEWRKIQYSSRSADYEEYIWMNLNSKHLPEACAKLAVTFLYEGFLGLDDPTEEACAYFLGRYQRCKVFYNQMVRRYDCGDCDIPCVDYEGFSMLNPSEWKAVVEESLEELRMWEAASREDTHESYWEYYSRYPRGIYARDAECKMQLLEEPAWEEALRINKRSAYEEFVRQFPQGFYCPEAYSKIVHSHLDTTSKKALENILDECCEYNSSSHSLILIGNINKEEKTYMVTLSGEQGYRVILKPGEYKWIEVADGDYTVLVEATGIQPWWGVVSCSGHVYSGAWFIRTIYRSFTTTKPLFGKETWDLNSKYNDSIFIDKEAETRFENALIEQCF